MTDQYYLGVDGGGTKTAFLILDGNGHTVGRHEGPTSYHVQIGLDGLYTVLDDGISAVLNQAGLNSSNLTYAFMGLPAHGEDSRVQTELDSIPAAILGHDRYTCGNDMVCGWAGSLACEDGINIVAGTGSIGYGENKGQTARAGGWGELFGDEGSAYWIGVQGLNAFSRMSDGRVKRGPLYDIIRSEFGQSHDLDLSGLLTGEANAARDRIAAISLLVSQAATRGDGAAITILKSAAFELAQIVIAVGNTLGFPADVDVPVSYSGGVFNARELMLSPFSSALSAASLRFRIIEPRFDPTVGAAIYAAKRSDPRVAKYIIERLGG